MKIFIVARTKEDVGEIREKILNLDKSCRITSKNPDFIVSYGGDGSFLVAERDFPGIPKLILRKGSICKKCNDGDIDVVLKKLLRKEYFLEEHFKLELFLNDKKIGIDASNDIIIRNKLQYHALRFEVDVGFRVIKNIIADGLVVATPFGSTAYFHSITGKKFEEGIGVAFNNPVEKLDPIISKDLNLLVRINRSDAFISFDNLKRLFSAKEGDLIRIKKSEEKFRIVRVI